MIRHIAIVLLAASTGCAGRRGGDASPHIDAVQPDSVVLAPGAVVTVVVRGRGFVPGTPGHNTVRFGQMSITDVPSSADGRELRLVIPENVPSRGDAAPAPLESGRYDIRVQTAAGTSNAISLRVDR